MLKKQLKLRLVLYPLIALFLYGVFAYFFTPQIKLLNNNIDTSVNILVLTKEPLFISYNPKLNKAVINNLNIYKKDLKDNKFLKHPPFNKKDYFTIVPRQLDRALFWQDFKNNLYIWAYKPYVIFTYFYDYAYLRFHGQTDINFATFLMFSWRLTSMTPADFILKNYEKPKNKKSKLKEDQHKITFGKDISKEKQEDKILVLEILNATDTKGLAATLTNYLRNLNNQGLLKVDVIDYKSYPVMLEETLVIDTSGRMESLKEVLLKIGLDTKEINTSSDKSPISDAKIILGKDFIMPK
ncbi:MAG: LytR C-terminal domain-containing protein [Elusimicrobiaceae bacterium]|nr:LytR C-terminal domain-containing protein [Elusimicrobiaceae bacterium]